MSVVTTRTVRVVATVDIEPIVEEIAASAPEDIIGICVALAASGGEDVTRELIAHLNAIEWVSADDDEDDETEDA